MKILVIDGMGGGVGRAVVERIKAELTNIEIMAVGANAIATTAMLKAGADFGATGENAVVYNASRADVIIGAMGIAFANAMYGEISPKMAAAVSKSHAHKILIPIEKSNVTIAGVMNTSMQACVDDVIVHLRARRTS